MGIWTMELPGWQPCPLNRLLHCHWGTAAKRKALDRDTIAAAVLVYGVPPATGKRRVELRIILAKGQRASDPDSFWKSLLDGLTHARAIRDDNRQWCELGPARFARGEDLVTLVTLVDVAMTW